MSFKSGFVAILGRPNVGKSTLLNKIIGEKIAITSSRPQTTRTRIMGVLTTETSQIIFTDTPGHHAPQNKLDEFMLESISSASSGSDLNLVVIDHKSEPIPNPPAGSWLIINKIDAYPKENLLPIIARHKDNFAKIFPISAKTGDGVDELLKALNENISEGPKYFHEDTLTDQPERVLMAEFIREKAMRLLGEELPYGIAVEISSMKDRENVLHVEATIFCEKKSHKAIIIGKKGDKIKQIGITARTEGEKFFGQKIYLELWVKVRENWRNSAASLRNFGYQN